MTTIALRLVPRSAPDPVSWPPAPGARPSIDPNQPPLPWTAEPAPNPSFRTAAGQPEHPRVRTVQFGDSAVAVEHGLPEPAGWSVRLAEAVLETLQGVRPVNQLSRWVDQQILAELTMHSRRRNREQATLTAVHLHQLGPAAVEAVAVYRTSAGRTGAMAFRLEGLGGRWLCTALTTGPGSGPG